MNAKAAASKVDLEKYRLRRFVKRLIDLGEVEIHDEPVALTGLSAIIESTGKALLFTKAGPERLEIVAKTAGSRRRLAAAFDTSEERLYDEYFKRLGSLQPLVEVPSDDAPVHAIKITGKDVDLGRLPFHPQHAYDGSCYLSAAIDYTIDPATGRRNVGCRRLSLRNRYEAGTNVTAPSDLKRIYTACAARRERLPITFTVGTHPLDFVAATTRRDALHHTLLHGSAFVLDQTDSANITALRTEAEAMKILRATVAEPVAVHLRSASGGGGTLRVSIRQRAAGEARAAIAAIFKGIMRLKAVYVFDDDIDIHDDGQTEWSLGTRFQADEDLVVLQGVQGQTMDPSLNGRKTRAKTGFDCTRRFGRAGEITYTRCAAKVFAGPPRFQTVEQALASGPMFYADVVESLGSDDGREVACALDALRQGGRLGRDRDGRYHLVTAKPGLTAIVGELYHDPNEGA